MPVEIPKQNMRTGHGAGGEDASPFQNMPYFFRERMMRVALSSFVWSW